VGVGAARAVRRGRVKPLPYPSHCRGRGSDATKTKPPGFPGGFVDSFVDVADRWASRPNAVVSVSREGPRPLSQEDLFRGPACAPGDKERIPSWGWVSREKRSETAPHSSFLHEDEHRTVAPVSRLNIPKGRGFPQTRYGARSWNSLRRPDEEIFAGWNCSSPALTREEQAQGIRGSAAVAAQICTGPQQHHGGVSKTRSPRGLPRDLFSCEQGCFPPYSPRRHPVGRLP
jgi:hypothetical protein